MPFETKQAIEWALTQTDNNGNQITKEMSHELVDKVREYFNQNNIEYPMFGYEDLKPYL